MKTLGIGLIGTGFMGKAHAIAYRTALAAFPDIPTPRLVAVADLNVAAAAQAGGQYGFESSTGDWKALIASGSLRHVTSDVFDAPSVYIADGLQKFQYLVRVVQRQSVR